MRENKLVDKIENKIIGNIYRFIYGKTPKNYKIFCQNYFKYADIAMPEEIYFGFLILYGIVLGIITFFLVNITGIFIPFKILLISTGVFIIFEITFHYIIVLIAEKRAKITEEISPDALKLMASNMRSGLTPDKALMLSARPEFGPLEVQIRKAAKKSLSGSTIQDALKVIPENINSKVLKRTIKLISDGISKGGDLSNLLDSIAEDISRTRILKKEVKAQVMMYSIFIFFAAAIAGPILYSISSYLVGIMSGFGEEIDIANIPKTGVINLNIGSFNISQDFLTTYSIVSLVITSIFGGILMGILKGGTEKDGIKYIPVVLLVSLGVYFISKIIIGGLFSSIT